MSVVCYNFRLRKGNKEQELAKKLEYVYGIDMDKVYLPDNIDEELLTGKNSRKAR